MDNVVNILIDCDSDRYVDKIGTTLFSLRQNLDSKYVINCFYAHYIDKKISNHSIKKIKKILGKEDKWIEIECDYDIDTSICKPWDGQVLLKLLALYHIDEKKYPKIIHLDGDVLIIDDIIPFFFSPYSDMYPIIGTKETFSDQEKRNNYYGLKDNIYLCAGVMIFHVKLFKKRFPTLESLVYAFNNVPFVYKASEQDFINFYFDNNKYCWPTNKYMCWSEPSWNSESSYADDNPAIIHYGGPNKPWIIVSHCNYIKIYWSYASQVYRFSYVFIYRFFRFIYMILFNFKKIIWKKKNV